MAKYRSGPNFVGQWIWTNGTVLGTLNFSADYSNFSYEYSVDLKDVSSGNAADVEYLAGMKDGAADLTLYDTINTGGQGTLYAAAFAPSTYGTLLWGPQGTATGKPKWGIAAYVKDFKNPLNFDDASKYEVSLQRSGAQLFGPSSTW